MIFFQTDLPVYSNFSDFLFATLICRNITKSGNVSHVLQIDSYFTNFANRSCSQNWNTNKENYMFKIEEIKIILVKKLLIIFTEIPIADTIKGVCCVNL